MSGRAAASPISDSSISSGSAVRVGGGGGNDHWGRGGLPIFGDAAFDSAGEKTSCGGGGNGLGGGAIERRLGGIGGLILPSLEDEPRSDTEPFLNNSCSDFGMMGGGLRAGAVALRFKDDCGSDDGGSGGGGGGGGGGEPLLLVTAEGDSSS